MIDGIRMLLWACPVCLANGSLVERDGWLRPHILQCTACHTIWRVDRVPGDDFRLTVVAGRPDVVGTSRPLAEWYARLKESSRPKPEAYSLPDRQPGEELYLTAAAIPLITSSQNPLFEGWREREAPRQMTFRRDQPADWCSLGTGRLDLTSLRLVWDDGTTHCDLWWRRVNTIFTYFRFTFGIMYGGEVYRFQFADQSILQWLTCASTVARPIVEAEGRRLSTTHF